MNGDPRYSGVGRTLPQVLPPLSMKAAARAYNRLIRAFGGAAHMPVGVAEARGGRPIRLKRTLADRCWASTKPTVGHRKGWGRLIHDASHDVFARRHPHARPHDGGHATLECEMAAYVAARPEWLHGKLEPVKRVTVRPDNAIKLARVEAAIIRWDAKARRAKTALAKLNRKAKYYRSKIT